MLARSPATLVLLTLLVACGTRESKIERLPPPELRDALPPPSVSLPAEPAPSGATAATPAQTVAPEPATGELTITRPAAGPEPTPTQAAEPGPVVQGSTGTPPATSAEPDPARASEGWPRAFVANGVGFEVYEPQVQSWDGTALMADSVVLAKPAGETQSTPGIVRMQAGTRVDEASGVVMLESLTLTDAYFPAAPQRTEAWLESLRAVAAKEFRPVPLARLKSGAALVEARRKGDAEGAVTTTPRIVLSRKPAVLVAIDGEPRYVPVPGTNLSGVRNTRAVLLKDAAGKVYLRLYDAWVSASSPRGPWTVAQPPPGADAALRLAEQSGRADLLSGAVDPKTEGRRALDPNALPLVLVSGTPLVLIVMDGDPQFAPIPGTNLRYVTNTAADVFRDVPAKKLYVLVEGSWYRAASAAGPWERVPAAALPEDFSRIPADSPKASVLASVFSRPSTAASTRLPDIAEVPRSQARFNVTIDGNPRLVPIAGTQLNYVDNASAPIIQLDRDHWYGFQAGVWFVADTVTGPWRVTDSVPSELYAIPPSSPVYHAVQARVFASSSSSVYYGYSADYHQTTTGATAGVSGHATYYSTPRPGLRWGWFY